MKITLINPPFLFPDKIEIVYSHALGLRYLSSFLKININCEVEFIDGLMLGFSNINKYSDGYVVGLAINEIVNRIPEDTDIAGISVPFSQLAPIAHDLAEKIRKRLPHSKIVMGGVYPSIQPKLALTSKADLIVIGEAENAFLEICKGTDPKNITGVYSAGTTVGNSYIPAEPIKKLDILPFPDYSIPLIDKYFNISPRMRRGRTASLITSRGCPFSCEFCSMHALNGKKYRYRSAENVLDEMKYLVKEHSINSFEIEDDNFTLLKPRTAEILEGIIALNEQGANLRWRTPNGVRIDTLDEDIIKLIKKSNCSEIVLALEHGDQEMLKIMNKQLDLDKTFHIIEMLVKHKINKITLFIIEGYPGETEERFINSFNYLKRVKKLGGNISVCVNIAQPYPGTKLLQRCKDEGYINSDEFEDFLTKNDIMSTGRQVYITTEDFDCEQVLKRKDMLMKYFGTSWKSEVRKVIPPWAINSVRRLLKR